MNIHVHIERLILEGLPVEQRQTPQVQAAVEAELMRLLAAGGLAPAWQTGGATPRVAAADIQLPGQPNPAHVGRQIAGAVYRGIGT